jgi:acetyl esterase/lipase
MKKIYTILSVLVLNSFTSSTAEAQCVGERFNSFVFPSNPVVTSDIVYGSNQLYTGVVEAQKLDVYEPAGDTLALRPLVIVAHGGSFLSGSKTGSDVVPMCKDFAKLGYVSASINYRLGMTNSGIPDSSDATEAVMRAVQDGRAAVRYFRKNAAENGNTYKIDPNNIYFAGVSAGGFVALQLAYLDEVSEIPAWADTTLPGLSGGIEGNTGNPGYNSDVKAIINICGALGDTAWMKAGDEPVLNFHGTNDGTVPYGSATIYLLGLFPLMQVDGSYSIDKKADQVGIENCFEIYEGQNHVPHVTDSAYYDTTIVIMRNFLRHYQCNVPLVCSYNGPISTGIENIDLSNNISLFPNPANGVINFQWKDYKGEAYNFQLINAMGQVVYSSNNIQKAQFQLESDKYVKGMYIVKIESNQKHFSSKIILE